MRIEGRRSGAFIRLSLWFARRAVRRIAGHCTEEMIEPAQAYARIPRLMVASGILEQATASLHGVDERVKVLAEMKAATLTNCEWCIDIGSQIARRAGVSDRELGAGKLPRERFV